MRLMHWRCCGERAAFVVDAPGHQSQTLGVEILDWKCERRGQRCAIPREIFTWHTRTVPIHHLPRGRVSTAAGSPRMGPVLAKAQIHHWTNSFPSQIEVLRSLLSRVRAQLCACAQKKKRCALCRLGAACCCVVPAMPYRWCEGFGARYS